MRKDIHPEYRPVVFHDLSADEYMIVSSTAQTKDTIDIDGTTYPVVRLEVSSASHPYYTGKRSIIDSTGRVDRFKKLYERSAKTQTKRTDNKKKVTTPKQESAKKTLADLADADVAK